MTQRDSRLRKILAAREARQRKWSDGDYPAAAYAAVDLLVERVPPPRRFNKDWRSHIESLIRDAVEPDDHRDAATIADAAEPTLKATLSRPVEN